MQPFKGMTAEGGAGSSVVLSANGATGLKLAMPLEVTGTFTASGGIVGLPATTGLRKLCRNWVPITADGWVVRGDNGVIRLGAAAAKLAACLIDGLNVGDTITGLVIHGSINSTGNLVTSTRFELWRAVDAAGTPAQTKIAELSPNISTSASLVINHPIALGTPEVVAANESHYLYFEMSSAASTEINLTSIEVVYNEA